MLTIEAVVITDTGIVRTHNEDSVTYVKPNDPDEFSSHGVLALVADGMGGHNAGEHASKLAVDTITRSYFRSAEEPRQALLNAIYDANREIYRASLASTAWKGMGTTCVVLAICNDEAWWAWVGDSRLYLLRDGMVYRLTEDHTVVQDMVRQGWMTQEEAHAHHDRNVLERAIGTRHTVKADASDVPIRLCAGDRLLLCTDGLHDLVHDEEMAGWAGGAQVSESAEKLIQAALARGGHDNISVILIEAKEEAAVRLPATKEHKLV